MEGGEKQTVLPPTVDERVQPSLTAAGPLPLAPPLVRDRSSMNDLLSASGLNLSMIGIQSDLKSLAAELISRMEGLEQRMDEKLELRLGALRQTNAPLPTNMPLPNNVPLTQRRPSASIISIPSPQVNPLVPNIPSMRMKPRRASACRGLQDEERMAQSTILASGRQSTKMRMDDDGALYPVGPSGGENPVPSPFGALGGGSDAIDRRDSNMSSRLEQGTPGKPVRIRLDTETVKDFFTGIHFDRFDAQQVSLIEPGSLAEQMKLKPGMRLFTVGGKDVQAMIEVSGSVMEMVSVEVEQAGSREDGPTDVVLVFASTTGWESDEGSSASDDEVAGLDEQLSYADLEPEDVLAVLPDSRFRRVVDVIFCLCVLAEFLIISTHFAAVPGDGFVFSAEKLRPWELGILVVSSICRILALPVNFRTAYLSGWELIGDEEDEFSQMHWHYITTWFAFDAATALPLDLISIPFSNDLFAPFSLVRFLPVWRIPTLFSSSSPLNISRPMGVKGFLFCLFLLISVHFLACLWVRSGGFDTGEPDGVNGDSFKTKYIKAAYWAVTTMTTVGYGDIVPITDGSRILASFTMLLGAGLFAYVMGNISNLLINEDPFKLRMRQQKKNLAGVFSYYNIPIGLQKEAFCIFPILIDKVLRQTEETVSALPPYLRQKFMHQIKLQVISKLPLFEGAPRRILSMLAVFFKEKIVSSHIYIIRQGDNGQEMFVLNKGMVDVLVTKDGKEERVVSIKPGSWFGEVALVRGCTRTASIKTSTGCQLFVLHRRDFRKICRHYPGFEDMIVGNLKVPEPARSASVATKARASMMSRDDRESRAAAESFGRTGTNSFSDLSPRGSPTNTTGFVRNGSQYTSGASPNIEFSKQDTIRYSAEDDNSGISQPSGTDSVPTQNNLSFTRLGGASSFSDQGAGTPGRSVNGTPSNNNGMFAAAHRFRSDNIVLKGAVVGLDAFVGLEPTPGENPLAVAARHTGGSEITSAMRHGPREVQTDLSELVQGGDTTMCTPTSPSGLAVHRNSSFPTMDLGEIIDVPGGSVTGGDQQSETLEQASGVSASPKTVSGRRRPNTGRRKLRRKTEGAVATSDLPLPPIPGDAGLVPAIFPATPAPEAPPEGKPSSSPLSPDDFEVKEDTGNSSPPQRCETTPLTRARSNPFEPSPSAGEPSPSAGDAPSPLVSPSQ
eukprot:Hpha_TRINITY_DN16350_c2_g1::TRINITY_DN16350_c2_g1_i1::g.61381::m.61381